MIEAPNKVIENINANCVRLIEVIVVKGSKDAMFSLYKCLLENNYSAFINTSEIWINCQNFTAKIENLLFSLIANRLFQPFATDKSDYEHVTYSWTGKIEYHKTDIIMLTHIIKIFIRTFYLGVRGFHVTSHKCLS